MNSSKLLSWTVFEYVGLGALLTADMFIIEMPSLGIRFLLAIALLASFHVPYLRRFTLPCLPIFAWLVTFYANQFIPNSYRPQHIFVDMLPSLERILYGANLSEVLSKHTHPALDVLAWLPYGCIHFAFPFVLAFLIFCFGPPASLKVFAKAFGYMNLAGVLTQLVMPCASPWYELSYGSSPATYDVPGQAGGLARIDQLLGLHLYETTFGSSPLVFGAFPSLHSGCATLEMLFMSYLFPKFRPLFAIYVLWLWWATMYLTHHYLIDLVGGSIYAVVAFAAIYHLLPDIHPQARTRLDYLKVKPFTIRALLQSIENDGICNKTNELEDDEESELMMHETKRPNLPNRLRIEISPPSFFGPGSLASGASSPYSLSEPATPLSFVSVDIPNVVDKED